MQNQPLPLHDRPVYLLVTTAIPVVINRTGSFNTNLLTLFSCSEYSMQRLAMQYARDNRSDSNGKK
jgi:hypothetical protein